MKNITEFSNIIKYDFDKCNQCRKCVYKCNTRALSLFNGEIKFKSKKCIACRECINVCNTNALYYNVNDGVIEGNNTIALIPFNADKKFLTKNYGNINTYEIGEKVKVIETAFEMENLTSKIICDEERIPLIVSDIYNFDLIMKVKFPKLMKYYSKVKNPYYITSYLERLKNKNKNVKIAAYGIPFENKMYFENLEIINEFCDIPFKSNLKYNLLDILNIYIDLCKLNSNIEVNELEITNNTVINLFNKNVEIKVLFITELNYLSSIEINQYDFIFVCSSNKYYFNNNLLQDDEVNKLYKNKLKSPGKTIAFFNKN